MRLVDGWWVRAQSRWLTTVESDSRNLSRHRARLPEVPVRYATNRPVPVFKGSVTLRP